MSYSARLRRLSLEQRGKGLGKNRELYPALLRTALGDLESVAERIGLEVEN